jgi:hypothetical protein
VHHILVGVDLKLRVLGAQQRLNLDVVDVVKEGGQSNMSLSVNNASYPKRVIGSQQHLNLVNIV